MSNRNVSNTTTFECIVTLYTYIFVGKKIYSKTHLFDLNFIDCLNLLQKKVCIF